eukprot:4122274-Pleurochrysis_carterae.AAC.1
MRNFPRVCVFCPGLCWQVLDASLAHRLRPDERYAAFRRPPRMRGDSCIRGDNGMRVCSARDRLPAHA